MPAVTKDILNDWGREAATLLLNDGIPLNTTLTKIAEENALNLDQIARLVESANISMHTSVYKNNKYPEFEVADIHAISKDITDAPKQAELSDYDISPAEFDFDFVEKTASYTENPVEDTVSLATQALIAKSIEDASRLYDEKVAELSLSVYDLASQIKKDVKQAVLDPDQREGALVLFKSAALEITPRPYTTVITALFEDIDSSLERVCSPSILKTANYVEDSSAYVGLNQDHPILQKVAEYVNATILVKDALDNKREHLYAIADDLMGKFARSEKTPRRVRNVARLAKDSNYPRNIKSVETKVPAGKVKPERMPSPTKASDKVLAKMNKNPVAKTPKSNARPAAPAKPALTAKPKSPAKPMNISTDGSAGNRLINTMRSAKNKAGGTIQNIGRGISNAGGAIRDTAYRGKINFDSATDSFSEKALGAGASLRDNVAGKARNAFSSLKSGIGNAASTVSSKANSTINSMRSLAARPAVATAGGTAASDRVINKVKNDRGSIRMNADQAAGNASYRQGPSGKPNAANQAAGSASEKVIERLTPDSVEPKYTTTGPTVNKPSAPSAPVNNNLPVVHTGPPTMGTTGNAPAVVTKNNAPAMSKVPGKFRWGLVGKILGGTALVGAAGGFGFRAGANAANSANAPMQKNNLPPRYTRG